MQLTQQWDVGEEGHGQGDKMGDSTSCQVSDPHPCRLFPSPDSPPAFNFSLSFVPTMQDQAL